MILQRQILMKKQDMIHGKADMTYCKTSVYLTVSSQVHK